MQYTGEMHLISWNWSLIQSYITPTADNYLEERRLLYDTDDELKYASWEPYRPYWAFSCGISYIIIYIGMTKNAVQPRLL